MSFAKMTVLPFERRSKVEIGPTSGGRPLDPNYEIGVLYITCYPLYTAILYDR